MKHELVLVIDFGGQYNQLIARRVRENNVYCEIISYKTDIEEIKAKNPKGIIFTGGPNSAYLEDSPQMAKEIYDAGIPILGICYGIQTMCHTLGGTVRKGTAAEKEYGKTAITYKESRLFEGMTTNSVWMSHTDRIDTVPEGFEIIAYTADCPVAGIQNVEKNLYGVQFHPEVEHSQEGYMIIKNFLYNICGVKGDWTTDSFIKDKVAELKLTTDVVVRELATDTSDAIFTLKQGTKVTVVENFLNGWYKIYVNNIYGYINTKDNVSSSIGIATGDVNIRTEANTNSNIVGVLLKGSKIEIAGQSGNFYKVKYKGLYRYISKKYLSDNESEKLNNVGVLKIAQEAEVKELLLIIQSHY